jgi:hypothetical protein
MPSPTTPQALEPLSERSDPVLVATAISGGPEREAHRDAMAFSIDQRGGYGTRFILININSVSRERFISLCVWA